MSNKTTLYPFLPLRDIVVFPQMIVPLYVGREMSILALEEAIKNDSKLVLCSQKVQETDTPGRDCIYDIGVTANVLQLLRLPEGTLKVLVEAQERVKITHWKEAKKHISVSVEPQVEIVDDTPELRVCLKSTRNNFTKLASLKKTINSEIAVQIAKESDPSLFANLLGGIISADVAAKQEILEIDDVAKKLEKILDIIGTEIALLDFENDMKSRVKNRMERNHREFFLNEQLKAIKKELGEDKEFSEVKRIQKRIEDLKSKLPEEAYTKAQNELKKIKSFNQGYEAQVSMVYLDWLIDLPWGERKEIQGNIQKAERILDQDHHGLTKVKERIIEFIAVQKRKKNVGGSIMCLVGPPGVGKTSLGQSVARATGREFTRIALGGLHDESEIRGHRRTYVGSMPGRIIKAFRKKESINPLILLDEIDKIGTSVRGDPSSAMLEVLDPEQNHKFHDNYLDVDFDLSEVMFITTANYLHDIPIALRDRMEIIQIDGYTEDEKLQIAKKHLLPELYKTQGIIKSEVKINSRVIEEIIRSYTREAGVRNLKRSIEKVMRKALTLIEKKELEKANVTLKNLQKFLGLPKFRHTNAEDENQVGVATGLAWSQAGGSILMIESTMVPGKGKMQTTGKLGEVMKESISAAHTYIRSIAGKIGVQSSLFEKIDIHVHVPEGSTPKEGPSAGIGMVTAVVSVLTGIPVRRDVAMTGEVTLRGNVLPIGGIKAKLLAAIRGGIQTVILPAENKRDLFEISEEIKSQLKIVYVSDVFDVLDHALVEKPKPVEAIQLESEKPTPSVAVN
ncbi:MAG: endopeptidase La [Rhodobacteraceae bacterium]|nr:endopeptidase La [Paracoccaceae bacterium]